MNDENDIIQSDDEDREVDHPERLDLLRKEIQRINFYICDPEKNVTCSCRYKEHCGKECFCTTNRNYSKKPNKPLTHDQYYAMAVDKSLKNYLGKG